MRFIGVDPGLKGAVCWYDSVTKEMRIIDNQYDSKKIPTVDFIKKVLDLPPASVAIVEDVQIQPGWHAKANQTLQRGVGSLTAMVRMHAQSVVLITPTSWKAQLALTNDKQLSIDIASLVFPQHRGKFTRDDRAEAALLIDWYLHGDDTLETT